MSTNSAIIAGAPEDWIALPELLAVLPGTTASNLRDWRRLGVFPFEPLHLHPAGKIGSGSYYPSNAAALLRRLGQLRNECRDPNYWLWWLWLDPANYPIDMRRWVLRYLDA
jgi:hypothetical protein